MKKQLFSLALILGLGGSFAATSFAADFGPDHDKNRRELRQDRDRDGRKHDGQDRKHGGRDDAQRQQQRLDRMAKELGLSKKQQGKVAQIFQDQHQQLQALRGRAQGANRGQLKAEAQRLRQSTDKKLKDVLSKKQYAQLEAQRQERSRRLDQQRRGDENRRDLGRRS